MDVIKEIKMIKNKMFKDKYLLRIQNLINLLQNNKKLYINLLT